MGRGGPGAKRVAPRRTSAENVRVTAVWVLERTLETGRPVDAFLEGAAERFEGRDEGLLRELVLGVLRWLRRLDHVIAAASNRSLQRIEEGLRTPLRVAAYQLLFLDRVPAHAAVNEAVSLARSRTHRGGAGFVNAVLRRIARHRSLEQWPVQERDQVRQLGIVHSHPDLLVRRWLDRFGREETETLLAANNQPKPWQLLAFRDRGGREVLAEELIDEGCDVAPSFLSPQGLSVVEGNPLATEAFRRGDFYVQDEASQVAALLPPPVEGERILDAAASPGGKSFSLLAYEPGVRLVLSDVSVSRSRPLVENMRRLGRWLPLVVHDAGAPAVASRFDRVVLDLPCSGTGTFRKHPELKWRVREDEIWRLGEQARRLASGVAPLVAPGGLLVLLTCSLEKEENEDVAGALIKARPEFHLEDLSRLPPVWAPWTEGPGHWRLFPGGGHDGFTVHVLRRRE